MLKNIMDGIDNTESITHEGVMDMFKSKNIETTFRTIFYGLVLNDVEFHHKGINFIQEYLNDENAKMIIHDSDIEEVLYYLKKFLSGSKKTLVIDKKLSNIDKDEYGSYIYTAISDELKSKHPFNWDSTIKMIEKTISDPRVTSNRTKKLLTDYVDLMKKVTEELSKDNKFTDKEITENPGLPKICPESALGEVWEDQMETLSGLSNELATLNNEGAISNFIMGVKTRFSKTLSGIINNFTNFFKSYSVTEKYFKQNIILLKDTNNRINKINTFKFSEIENLNTKIVIGMKLDYISTVKELKVFLDTVKNLKQDIDNITKFISNIYNNYEDIRKSNRKDIDMDSLFVMASKTESIIKELIDGKSYKEEKEIGKLFYNITSIKNVRDELIVINETLLRLDVDSIKTSTDSLISITKLWIENLTDKDGYSNFKINEIQSTIETISKTLTNFGMLLTLSNSFTSYYITTLDVIVDKDKFK